MYLGGVFQDRQINFFNAAHFELICLLRRSCASSRLLATHQTTHKKVVCRLMGSIEKIGIFCRSLSA
jgi:hypothetical protein